MWSSCNRMWPRRSRAVSTSGWASAAPLLRPPRKSVGRPTPLISKDATCCSTTRPRPPSWWPCSTFSTATMMVASVLNFALAYAGQADAYAEQADADLAPEKAFVLSKQTALRALSINPDLAEAHVSLANALFYSEWKWADAEREYKRALELKPTYEEAHHSYSHYLTLAGRHAEAIEESQLLLRLDPLSSHMNSHLGLAYLKAGRFDEALAQFKKTIALDPNYMRVYVHLGFAYEWRKMFPEAITAYKKGVSLAGETLEGQADLARALIEGSERKEGLLILRRLESEKKRRYVSPVDLAGIYTVLGDHEKAMTLLENALEQHNGRLLFIHQYHEFDPLRNSPRFTRILQAVGAPAAL